MNQQVHVRSFEAVQQYRAALVSFLHTARGILQQTDQLVLRMVQWAGQERPSFWQAELRRSWDLVARARQELAQCEQQYYGEDRATCYQQRKALEAAKRYTQHAEEKVHTARQWSAQAQRAWTQYRGSTQPLRTLLESEAEKHLAFFDRVLASLEQYVQTAAPESLGTQAAPAGNAPGGGSPPAPAAAPAAALEPPVLEELLAWVPVGPERKQLFAQSGLLPPLALTGAGPRASRSPERQEPPPPWQEAACQFARDLGQAPLVPEAAAALVVRRCPFPKELAAAGGYVAVRRPGQLPRDSGWTILEPAAEAEAPVVREVAQWFAEHPEAAPWLGLAPPGACLVSGTGLLEVRTLEGDRLWPPRAEEASS